VRLVLAGGRCAERDWSLPGPVGVGAPGGASQPQSGSSPPPPPPPPPPPDKDPLAAPATQDQAMQVSTHYGPPDRRRAES
jgi:hypothetical protein